MATPFMNLDLPTVSVTLGPQWATDLNAALTLVDSHDHSTGKGTKITPTGLNINADLDINQQNTDNARSYRMFDNTALLVGGSDLTSIYAKDGDLYYNNNSGTAVQITSGATINASSIGGIGGDYATSPAIVNYTLVNNTYTFDEDTNKRAKMDFGEFTVRETSVTSANGITIKSPTSLASAYTMTLLTALPASTKPLFISATGQIDATSEIQTTDIADNAITNAKMFDNAIDTAEIVDEAVTKAKQEIVTTTIDGSDPGAGGVVISSSTGALQTFTNVGTFNDVTNASVTLTTTGRPVILFVQPADDTTITPGINVQGGAAIGGLATGLLKWDRGAGTFESPAFEIETSGADVGQSSSVTPATSLMYIDHPAAGTHTYKLKVGVVRASDQLRIEEMEVVAYEI